MDEKIIEFTYSTRGRKCTGRWYPRPDRISIFLNIIKDGTDPEEDSDVDICSKAIVGLRDGSLDGDSQVVHSEKVRDVELDFKTDLPFDRSAWIKAKLLELGINANGDPLKPGEKVRPENETTLNDFQKQSKIARIKAHISEWSRRCRQAFKEGYYGSD